MYGIVRFVTLFVKRFFYRCADFFTCFEKGLVIENKLFVDFFEVYVISVLAIGVNRIPLRWLELEIGCLYDDENRPFPCLVALT